MGNCVDHFKHEPRSLAGDAEDKHHKALRIVKIDGKVLELKSPITVKELLVNFSAFGVAVSEKATQNNLPPTYELKMGKTYYLRSSPNSSGIISPANTLSADETGETGGVKRIKVVITKQQLQELLSKRISFEDVLSGLGVGGRTSSSCTDSTSTCWKPKLEPIEELIEWQGENIYKCHTAKDAGCNMENHNSSTKLAVLQTWKLWKNYELPM